jgi:hypothetical protein
MTIFLVLNGMALVFMLYVLVNFWKEGNRTTRGSIRLYRLQSLYGSKPEVFVVTQSLGFEAKRPGKTSLIQFPLAKGRTNLVGEESAQAEDKITLNKYSPG